MPQKIVKNGVLDGTALFSVAHLVDFGYLSWIASTCSRGGNHGNGSQSDANIVLPLTFVSTIFNP